MYVGNRCDDIVGNPHRSAVHDQGYLPPGPDNGALSAAPPIGSVGDPIDNAVAESTIGLFKNELIRRRGPWRHVDDVEFATLGYVDWFNHRRLHSEIGNVPPVEAEHDHYCQQTTPANKPKTEQISLH